MDNLIEPLLQQMIQADKDLAAAMSQIATIATRLKDAHETLASILIPAPVPTPPPPPPPVDPLPPPPPVDPLPPPRPGPSDLRYRHQQPGLFQRTDQAVVRSRLPGGVDLKVETGPTCDFVSVNIVQGGATSAWPWDNRGGDWIDADGVRQGPKPWASQALNAVIGNSTEADYSINVTSLLQHVQLTGRWLAFVMQGGDAARVISGRFSADGLPNNPEQPLISVLYEDGSTATLECLVVAGISNNSNLPRSISTEVNLPVMMEFKRPAKAVRSASLAIHVTQHWAGKDTTARIYLLDPPVKFPAVELGIADAAPLDAGLVGNADIIGVHRYLDGTKADDVICPIPGPAGPSWNFGAERDFDPAIFGTGPADLTKLPHIDNGKWFVAKNIGKFDLVQSSHAGDGFVPLVPGMGAVRVEMPQQVFADGDVISYDGTGGANAKIFLPEALFARLQHIFVRQYFRIGTPDGGPYEVDPLGSFQVHKSVGDAGAWIMAGGGKGLVMPAHDTAYGGVSGTAGGGYGWQMRMGWHDADYKGPEEGGALLYPHLFDFQKNNPPGFRYGAGDSPIGGQYPQGVHGTVAYAHRWYCFETELFLNSVDKPAVLPDGKPHIVNGVQQFWTPDGYMRQWLDGRLCYEARGMVTRSLPVVNAAPNPLSIRPLRELGVRDLWFNWFHGGTVKNARKRVMFVTGLAWGHKYIGPMRLR